MFQYGDRVIDRITGIKGVISRAQVDSTVWVWSDAGGDEINVVAESLKPCSLLPVYPSYATVPVIDWHERRGPCLECRHLDRSTPECPSMRCERANRANQRLGYCIDCRDDPKACGPQATWFMKAPNTTQNLP